MLLDGVPLYSVNHLFGFFSVFNADAVKNMSITKGGFPARFGGRLSSILEINMKDGNMREFHGDGNISIIASKLTLEGPIVKDKASFMVSARRTYLDLLLNPIIAAPRPKTRTAVDPAYYFYDLNGKLNWRVSPRDRVYVFWVRRFWGDDVQLVHVRRHQSWSDVSLGLDWKNQIQALRWNHELGPRMFSNVSLTHSVYNFNTGVDFKTNRFHPPTPARRGLRPCIGPASRTTLRKSTWILRPMPVISSALGGTERSTASLLGRCSLSWTLVKKTLWTPSLVRGTSSVSSSTSTSKTRWIWRRT